MVAANSCCEHCSIENLREGNEPGSLEGPTGWDVGRIATRAGNGAEFVAQPLQFLDQVGAQAAPPKRLTHFHVEVAIRPIIVKQDASFAGNFSIDFQEPLAASLPSLQTS